MQPAAQSDLGELLTTRTKGPGQRFVLALVALALGGVGLGFTVTSILSFGTVGQPAPPGSTPVTTELLIVMSILGTVALWLSWLALRGALSVYRFHERGLTRSMLGKVMQAIEFDRTATLHYRVTRRYLNGIYRGTDVELILEALPVGGKKGDRIAYRGVHREKPQGLLSRTFLAKNFQGEDELDAIKNFIAQRIANRWLLSGDFRESWAGGIFLTPAGMTTERGRFAGKLLPYSQVRRITEDGEYLRIYYGDGDTDFLLATRLGRNFWPGLALVNAMQAH